MIVQNLLGERNVTTKQNHQNLSQKSRVSL